MGDILKEALAEAKLVKKVAIEAAREQLNEALTPKIESMLSKKIREEMDDEYTEDDDEELDETEDPGKNEEDETKNNQDVTSGLSETEDPGKNEEGETKNNKDVTPNLSEEDEVDIDVDDEDDTEIEEILRELEDDEEIPVEDEPVSDGDDSEVDIDIDADDEEEVSVDEEEIPDEESIDDDEDINVEEILNSIDEEEYPGDDNSEDKDSEQQNVASKLESKQVKSLKEKVSKYGKAVGILKNELSEVNLLNNKLFHTTKLLKKFNVSNKTKMNIIETFDRAKNVREVKLIYTTLYESLKYGSRVSKPKIKTLSEVKQKTNSASKTVLVEKYNPDPTILSEGDDLKKRFQKLANIKG